jgi:hypothetical protein
VSRCLFPGYRKKISANRSHMTHMTNSFWREGRSEPKDLRLDRRTSKINPKIHYNNTVYLFWPTNITGRFWAPIHFVVSWDPCVAINIAGFIVFLSHVPFCFKICYRMYSQGPKVCGTSVVPTPQIRTFPMSLLLIFKNKNSWFIIRMWHNS